MTSTLNIYNNLLIDQFTSTCKVFHINFDELFSKTTFSESDSDTSLLQQFGFYIFHDSILSCDNILESCGKQKVQYWIIGQMFYLINNYGKNYTINRAVESLTKNIYNRNIF